MTEYLGKQLIIQRSIERALENFRKVGKSNLTAAKIRSRISLLKELWTQYQDGHVHLLEAVPAKDKPSLDYFARNSFEATEDIYQSSLDVMKEYLEDVEPVVSHNLSLDTSHSPSDTHAISQSHMPKIKLPPFEGEYSDWETFQDRFSALIIKNHTLNDFARMHYLTSSLKGRALDCINNLPVTADNFQIAWDTLTARFENKTRLLASHFSNLFQLSAMNKESVSELQFLIDKVNIAIASMRNLDHTPSDLWEDFLVHLITNKLDGASKKAWNLKTSDADTPPSYDSLNRFLQSRIRALEEYKSQSDSTPSKPSNSKRIHVATASNTSNSLCPLCKLRHYLYLCPKFVAQAPIQRRETIKRLKRCFNCLSSAHSVLECKSVHSCRTCHKRHHTLIHNELEAVATKPAQQPETSDTSSSSAPAASNEVTTLVASANPHQRSQVLLATAMVKVTVDSGRSVVVRALVDQGSEATFISENVAQTPRETDSYAHFYFRRRRGSSWNGASRRHYHTLSRGGKHSFFRLYSSYFEFSHLVYASKGV